MSATRFLDEILFARRHAFEWWTQQFVQVAAADKSAPPFSAFDSICLRGFDAVKKPQNIVCFTLEHAEGLQALGLNAQVELVDRIDAPAVEVAAMIVAPARFAIVRRIIASAAPNALIGVHSIQTPEAPADVADAAGQGVVEGLLLGGHERFKLELASAWFTSNYFFGRMVKKLFEIDDPASTFFWMSRIPSPSRSPFEQFAPPSEPSYFIG